MNPQQFSILRQEIGNDLRLGRVAGPFVEPPFNIFISTPIFVVPKSSPGRWRVIHDLSCKGLAQAPNQLIADNWAAVQYASFDHALSLVAKIGPGARMGKQDVSDAFKILPVRPSDYPLLGFQFDNNFYYETVLPFGCRSSCLFFERFATFVEWIWKQRRPGLAATHYLDDFFNTAKSDEELLQDWEVLEKLAREIGLPLARDKKFGPSTKIVFLGLEIDSVAGLVFVPEEKILKIRFLISEVLSASRVSKKSLQRLLGHLCFAGRILVMARPFLRRLYAFLAVFKSAADRRRLGEKCRRDLIMWKYFFDNKLGPFRIFNRSFFWHEELELFTDASSSHGCGGMFGRFWFSLPWSDLQIDTTTWSIAALEFLPIIFAIVIWGQSLTGKKIIFRCDNEALVSVLNQKTASDPVILALLRIFVIFCVDLDIEVRSRHIPGIVNSSADALSRGKLALFRRLNPDAVSDPVFLPNSFWPVFRIFVCTK